MIQNILLGWYFTEESVNYHQVPIRTEILVQMGWNPCPVIVFEISFSKVHVGDCEIHFLSSLPCTIKFELLFTKLLHARKDRSRTGVSMIVDQ